jgi:hypothetical protein
LNKATTAKIINNWNITCDYYSFTNSKNIKLIFLACTVDGRIILRWIFRKWEGVVGTGWSWLRIGTGGGRL